MKNTAQRRISGDDFQKLLACLTTSEPMDDLRTHQGPTSDPVQWGGEEDE